MTSRVLLAVALAVFIGIVERSGVVSLDVCSRSPSAPFSSPSSTYVSVEEEEEESDEDEEELEAQSFDAVNCNRDNRLSVRLECSIKLSQQVQVQTTTATTKAHDCVHVKLTLHTASGDETNASSLVSVFYWDYIGDEHHRRQKRERRTPLTSLADPASSVFRHNASVALSTHSEVEDINRNATLLSASLLLYGIEASVVYRVCAVVPGVWTSHTELCCRTAKVSDEKPVNFLMSLIVIAIIAFIQLVVVFVFWRCEPSAFKSIDDMLQKLPSSHVKMLRRMVAERGDNIATAGIGVAGGDPGTISTRRREGRDADAKKKSRVNFNIPVVESAPTISRNVSDGRGGEGGRTTEERENQADLKAKIFNENRRRHSIKPFKKAFVLDVSSSSSESSESDGGGSGGGN